MQTYALLSYGELVTFRVLDMHTVRMQCKRNGRVAAIKLLTLDEARQHWRRLRGKGYKISR